MDAQDKPILLVGITVRMLAEMAWRAGYGVVSADYFGDADLRRFCSGISLLRDRSTSYSAEALVNAAGELDAPYVVYGASLENHPKQVARLAKGRSLLGNTPETLARARDPHQLAATLQAAGFCFPQTAVSGQQSAVSRQHSPDTEHRKLKTSDRVRPAPTVAVGAVGGNWLWKPQHSGGGHGVQFWDGRPLAEADRQPVGGILQEWVPGLVASAAFVANGLEAVVVGLTEQLVGDERFGAGGFRYCGNVMPPPLAPDELRSMLAEVHDIVNLLTAEFGLRGLNGLDFIWHEGRVWTIELNPRPTAPLELMELAYGLSLFAAHVQSFSGRLPSFDLELALANAAGHDARPSPTAAGKAILFASSPITVGDTSYWYEQDIRDIPYPGDHIKQGDPICTILATAESPEQCKQKLAQRAAEVMKSASQQFSISAFQLVSISADWLTS